MDPLKLGFGEQLVLLLVYCYILFKFLNFYIAFAVLITSFTAIYKYLKYRSEYWKRLGINGPKGNILFGHSLEMRKGFDVIDTEWTEKYGQVFGTIVFSQPELVVSDFEILRHVLVKDFSSFTNRKKMFGLKTNNDSGRIMSRMLMILEDDDWKNIRNTITPAFTTGKMKNMVHIFNGVLKILGEVVSKYTVSDSPMDVKEVCGGFAMDLISKSAFGMDIDAQRDCSSPFIKFAKELFNITSNPKLLLIVLFPKTIPKIDKMLNYRYQFVFGESDKFFKHVLRMMIAERQKNPQKMNPDFLQLLVNSASSDQTEKMEIDKEISHEEIFTGKRGKLTELEIMSQSFLFLLAGYETTATSLQFALYILAMHPEIQDKVVKEILTVIGNSDDILYEHIGKLTYLDQVISETLRMFCAPRIDRECSRDVTVNGLTIPKGCSVGIPVWLIHHNPEIYPDPERFDPERFSPEEKANRDPLAYLPFGYGPRNCIGMRFAQLELRMSLAYLIKNFKFSPCEKTPKMPIKLNMIATIKTASPIFLSVAKRDH